MNEPIKAGDMAVVIGGMLGDKSPNIGLIVKVVSARGEHSKYGRIWHVMQSTGSVVNQVLTICRAV